MYESPMYMPIVVKLFILVKEKTTKDPLVQGWLHKSWYIHTMEYFATAKKIKKKQEILYKWINMD